MGCPNPATPPAGPAEVPGPLSFTLGEKIELTVSCLTPKIDANDSESSSSGLTFGTDEEWETYLGPSNIGLIGDIFGDPDKGFRTVTKIRVLLEQFRDNIDRIVSRDEEMDCAPTTPLSDRDTIDVAFYGGISNGTSGDRHFDCFFEEDGNLTVYGKDSLGNIRIITMSEEIVSNSVDIPARGDAYKVWAVVFATYAERAETDGSFAYVDLQFAHSSQYKGTDGLYGTSDDMTFKSRTRVTGRASPGQCGEDIPGSGEFTSTRFDRMSGAYPPEVSPEGVTKTIGRGDYGPNQFSLFRIDSNEWSVVQIPRTFCLKFPLEESGLPSPSDPANCSAFENAFAWGTIEFPFPFSPSLEASFEEKPFFEASDLIGDAGEGFVIPELD